MKILTTAYKFIKLLFFFFFIITTIILSLNTIEILFTDRDFLDTIILIAEIGLVVFFIVDLFSYLHFSLKNYPKDIIVKKRYDSVPEEYINDVYLMIPAFNEELSIQKAIEACLTHVKNVLVIDDGSVDDTVENAKKAGAFVISHNENLGLASAMKTGINWCLQKGAKIIVNFDADMQYDANDIPSLIMPIIENKYDLVIGNRFEGGIESMPLKKQYGNKLFSRVIANFTGTHISDAQSGYRAFSDRFARSIKIREGFTYTQQMIIEAAEKKFRIGEIPIKFAKRDFGSSRLMHGVIDFAVGAWKLIIRVYLEYKPLVVFSIPAYLLFNIGAISLLESMSHFLYRYNIGLLFFLVSLFAFSTSLIIFMIGLYAFSKKEEHY